MKSLFNKIKRIFKKESSDRDIPELKIEISGPLGSGKSTAVELIKELFDLYGVPVKIKGKNKVDSERRERIINVINKLESVTIIENGNKFYIDRGDYV